MTLLEVTNKVLKKLREDVVSATDENEYSSLIADFVVDIHAECAEEHDWSSFKHEITLAVSPGVRTYNLGLLIENGGNVPNDERVTNNSSLVVFDDRNMPMAFLYDDTSEVYGEQIFAVAPSTLERLFHIDRSLDNEEPYHFSYRLHPDNEGLELNLWPLPAVERVLRIQFWTPPELIGDGTDDDTELLLPWRPVYLGALMMGLNERGEEIGEPGNLAEQRFRKALSNYIESDLKLRDRTNQNEFVRD